MNPENLLLILQLLGSKKRQDIHHVMVPAMELLKSMHDIQSANANIVSPNQLVSQNVVMINCKNCKNNFNAEYTTCLFCKCPI